MSKAGGLEQLREEWRQAWPGALAVWSRFTKLPEPYWCLTEKEETKQGLAQSFAMIRFRDHKVVISLRLIKEENLEDYSREILAHEIGHHVLAPGDLRDSGRLLIRIRKNLPGIEQSAPVISNLYTDLLINDALERRHKLRMKDVFKALKSTQKGEQSSVWELYLRIYEHLWALPAGELVNHTSDEQLALDAVLGARIIRVYAEQWVRGSGRFAALFLPWLLKDKKEQGGQARFSLLLDSSNGSESGEIPDLLTEVESDEEETVHPLEDPMLNGSVEEALGGPEDATGIHQVQGRAIIGGIKIRRRTPKEYLELMEGLKVRGSRRHLLARYYQELARPYIINFPVSRSPNVAEPHPEGLDLWDLGDGLSEVDWVETASRSPYILPGVTTLKRLEGVAPEGEPGTTPVDLYIGIDCSGSMANPAYILSYPVLAGAVLSLSALRAGASVMACLSGEEPGEYVETEGFLRDESRIFGILTDYLGTGYSFGIKRLKDTFLSGRQFRRPVHLVIVTDSDIFQMLNAHKDGWNIARESAAVAGGGATCVLQLSWAEPQIAQLREAGWDVYVVTGQEDLVLFARDFARRHYERDALTRELTVKPRR